MFHLPASGNSKLQGSPPASLHVPQHWDRECGSSSAAGGTAEIQAGRRWDGTGEAYAVVFLGKLGLCIARSCRFSQENGPKNCWCGISACISCAATWQCGGGSPGGPTASTRERVSVGSRLLWILPDAIICLGNKLFLNRTGPSPGLKGVRLL